MGTDTNDNRRLEPLVRLAYAIYTGTEVPLPPPEPQSPLPPATNPLTKEHYQASVERTIATQYSFPAAGMAHLMQKARSGAIGKFTDEDCQAAVQLLNALLSCSLFEESKTCGGPKAIAAVQAQIPGFSAEFYKEIMNRMECYNR